ncbi:MAG: hypothetical protein WCX77_03390 [Candidatus Paceibacterota bacterium]|jgi:predicted PurR-regulated permease PerM
MAKNILSLIFIIGLVFSFALFIPEVNSMTNEIQQQLDGAQKTIDTVGQQAQSIKEKGLVQTIWDNATAGITAAVSGIFQQISQIWNQITSIFSVFSK